MTRSRKMPILSSSFFTVTAVKNDSFYFLVRTEHLAITGVFSQHFNSLSKSVLCRIVMKVVALDLWLPSYCSFCFCYVLCTIGSLLYLILQIIVRPVLWFE